MARTPATRRWQACRWHRRCMCPIRRSPVRVADWLAGVVAVEGTPDARMREALAPGTVMVNREGHQFTRHTVSFHAPDAEDAGLLARQAEIEELEKRCSELEEKVRSARGRAGAAGRKRLAAERVARPGSPGHFATAEGAARRADRGPQARPGAGALPGAQHARCAPSSTRCAAPPIATARRWNASQQAAARIGEEITRMRAGTEAAREALLAAESALAGQRQAAQQAEREAQDALFGERECGSKIAEIDNSVRVIDEQIGRGDTEVARLNQELAADPIPGGARIAGKRGGGEDRLREEPRRSAQCGGSCRRRAARARGSEAAGRVARGAAARAHGRAAPQGAGGADQFRPVRLAAAPKPGANEELLATEAAKAPRRLQPAGRDHAPYAGDQ